MVVKILFIVNPVAGNGKSKRYWEIYRERIFSELGEKDYIFTEYPGHATELARKNSSGNYDIIVSAGGDGTLNEVINGAVNSPCAITVLPLGTGSDFGKTVGIRTLDDFLNAIKIKRNLIVDVPLVEFSDGYGKRYFINILEIGFGAEVMAYVNRHKSLGRYSFLMGVLATLSQMKKFNVNIRMDNDLITLRTMEIIIANGRYFGGGMLASPESSINDGILDVHVLKPYSKFRSALQLRDLITGKYIKKGYALNYKAKNIFIEGKDQLVEMDGEVVGHTPLNVYMDKGKVNFLVP